MEAATALVGRILLSIVFILSGVGKIAAFAPTVQVMHMKGIRAAPFFLFIAIVCEVAGGLSILVGYRARMGALLLFAFLIPVTYIFHFKTAFDHSMVVVDRGQLYEVLKNLSIMGGLLMVFCHGAGKWVIGKHP